MLSRFFLLICALFIATAQMEPAFVQSHQRNTQVLEASRTDRTGPASTQSAPVNREDLEAMKTDTKKMRVILNQMRTNLAFVQTTTTPLKHQFELEIDMWQVLVEHMERRIKQMERPTSGKPAQ